MRSIPPKADLDTLLAFDLLDPLTEVCEDCGKLIRNWTFERFSFLTYDGKIVCNGCRTERLKKEFET